MKKVEATIQPWTLDTVRDGLLAIGCHRITIAEVKTLDSQARAVSYRGTEYVAWFTPRLKLEIVVSDAQLDDCVETLRRCGEIDAAEPEAILIVSAAAARPGVSRRRTRPALVQHERLVFGAKP